jgi:integrase/recombinase XerD
VRRKYPGHKKHCLINISETERICRVELSTRNSHISKKTLQQFHEEFISECQFSRRLRPETLRGYKSVFKLFLLVMPEVVYVESLTPDIMKEFFKRIETREKIVGKNNVKSGIRDSTVKTYWNKLNSYFQWLLANSNIQKSPLENIQPPEPTYDNNLALETCDIEKIFTAITLHSQNALLLRRDMLIVNILLFCGVRKGEFISLQVRDIDFEKAMLTVRGETSKSKKTRHIPIHRTLMLHLMEYITERNKRRYKTPYLIVSSNGDSRLTVHGLKHWVDRLNELSGVKFHLHRFRHTFACNLAMANVGLIKIQKLMGHADPKMTATYLRSISTEDLRDDINKLSI